MRSAVRTTGVDRQTSRRVPTVARRVPAPLVNTVVGFIGPEYLYDGKQIIRAGLEDHFCGKLLGLPMGCDVCYTNHAEADQDDMDDKLLRCWSRLNVNYVMGVPGADDIMLGYQSTSRPRCSGDCAMCLAAVRRRNSRQQAWLRRQGVMDGHDRIQPARAGDVPRAVTAIDFFVIASEARAAHRSLA